MTEHPDPVEATNSSTTSRGGGRAWIAVVVLAAIVCAAAASVGAYLNWMWWPVSYGGGLLIALAAGVLLLLGGIGALIARRLRFVRIQRVALFVLAAGVGLVAGESLGPSRERLLDPQEGTMTLRLESPVVAVATGPATCTNVASATEFAVTGDSNIRLDTPDQPFVSISVDKGDRWQVLQDGPRKDGVLLRIDVTAALVTDGGKPGTIGMRATGSSTMTSTFSNSGGSIRFAGLAAQSGPDFTGDSVDLAGTLEWTCSAGPAATP